MELKDKFITSYAPFEAQIIGEVDALRKIRLEGLKTFEAKGFPTKKEEAWKYTSLNSLLKKEYNILPAAVSISKEEVKEFFLKDTDTYKLVFINGVLAVELSDYTSDIATILPMSVAFKNEETLSLLNEYYNQTVNKDDSLTALNTAFAAEGAFIYVGKSKVVDKPIELVYLSTSTEEAVFTQPRNLVIVGENAQVKIVERHQNIGTADTITNVVTEIYSEKHALCDYYKLQNDVAAANLIDNTYIKQGDSSRVCVHTFSFGGKLTRNNLNFYQEGEHIDSTLKGITIIGNKQHVDHYTLVSHNQPNCESHQNYKSIFDDSAVGVFNGKIYVDKIAQKTDGFQQNNNILLSDKATVYTKPQLEIFADDVKCSHGCTIGQLDDEAMFYMRQRGIPQREAKALLMYAFTEEVMSSISIPSLRLMIANLIASKLGVSMDFEI
ncbi:Fe-S cluster assembly protein SufD [Myroides pelagicus]|uniref:Fe-S cluster assembly protein SufD n=1 Tax=Myroides pelagicus TaxID=270914 RepID=A0A7K1GP52_9FLAO|nr:Fe-S cluster assembly protein SufD [Myroides pelagicus]MEC4113318.1 Fe-S cluster assembly protein SufD [Myroides pelagicus]MTH30530.1 Fe-S cluster assembly protein SufD [Myroides pelagicus]